MTIEFKDYAKDIKLNLSSVLKPDPESGLSQNQLYGIALSCSYMTNNKNLIKDILEKSVDSISDEEIEAAKGATTLMAMNNIYYRFVHLSSDKEYHNMPAKLRMNLMANPGIDKVDFELYSLAVSCINGCGLCIDSHTKQLVASGVSKATIQHTVRIAAVINAAATALTIN